MKILFVSTYYPAFLSSFYARYGKALLHKAYKFHKKKLLGELFGDSDFYSEGVRKNGIEAEDVVANDGVLQKKWAKENKFRDFSETNFFSKIPYLEVIFKPNWVEKILSAQIKKIDPDILYFQDIEYFTPRYLREKAKKYFIVAQKASPVWRMESFRQANLVFTSFPHFVRLFRSHGINSEYLKLAFAPKVLKAISKQKKIYGCTFIGGISSQHSKGLEVLYKVASAVSIDVFGYGKNILDKSTPLYKMHHGEVWGRDMFKEIMRSLTTINRHIDVAGKYANNMRLFEATGSGAMLLTDAKVNIGDFFRIGKEVVVYKNADDLIKKIKYYLRHPQEAEKIAKAGQKRTLWEHSYEKRMGEMLNLLLKYY